jgi:hypothetical protein
LFAGTATVMQAVESETLILHHAELDGQWPVEAARAFAATLPYARRLAAGADRPAARASLAGLALAVHALSELLARRVHAGELIFIQGQKPALAGACARLPDATPLAESGAASDFSIAHSGPWVGCAALSCGQVGFDVEVGTDARIAEWVVREAALKATGDGLRALRELPAVADAAERLEFRGRSWHVRRLQMFRGACAALVTSRAVPRMATRRLALAELFAT